MECKQTACAALSKTPLEWGSSSRAASRRRNARRSRGITPVNPDEKQSYETVLWWNSTRELTPWPTIQTKAHTGTQWEEISGDQRTRTKKFTRKPWQEELKFLLTASFPSIKRPFFTYWGNDYKTGWNALCRGMYYILGGLLGGIGSACMSCCRELERYKSVARCGKKAGEIKKNDVAHLLYLYSISPPQTAGPGCGDERLSGGQERRPWVRGIMASCLLNAPETKIPPHHLFQFLGLDVLMKALSLWIVG